MVGIFNPSADEEKEIQKESLFLKVQIRDMHQLPVFIPLVISTSARNVGFVETF